MIGSMGYNERRNRLIDYPYAVAKQVMTMMIPKPTAQKTNYLGAVWDPFQIEVSITAFYNFVKTSITLLLLIFFRFGFQLSFRL